MVKKDNQFKERFKHGVDATKEKIASSINEEDKEEFKNQNQGIKDEFEGLKDDFFDVVNGRNFFNILCIVLLIISIGIGVRFIKNMNTVQSLNRELSAKQEQRQNNIEYNDNVEKEQRQENNKSNVDYITNTGDKIIDDLFTFEVNGQENSYADKRLALAKKYPELKKNKHLDLSIYNIQKGEDLASGIRSKSMYIGTKPDEVGYFIEQSLSFGNTGDNSVKYWFASVKGTDNKNVEMDDYYPLQSFE